MMKQYWIFVVMLWVLVAGAQPVLPPDDDDGGVGVDYYEEITDEESDDDSDEYQEEMIGTFLSEREWMAMDTRFEAFVDRKFQLLLYVDGISLDCLKLELEQLLIDVSFVCVRPDALEALLECESLLIGYAQDLLIGMPGVFRPALARLNQLIVHLRGGIQRFFLAEEVDYEIEDVMVFVDWVALIVDHFVRELSATYYGEYFDSVMATMIEEVEDTEKGKAEEVEVEGQVGTLVAPLPVMPKRPVVLGRGDFFFASSGG